MQWQPIETAFKDNSREIIGSVWRKRDGHMICVREPFITFFSPTLGRFFADPTHWTPLPIPPEDSA